MAQTLSLLGIAISVDANTEYEDLNEQVLSADELFSTVMEGDLVEAEGQKTSTDSLLAEELEFED